MIPSWEADWSDSDNISWTCLTVLLASSSSFQIKNTSSQTPATAREIINRTSHFYTISAFCNFNHNEVIGVLRTCRITLFSWGSVADKCCSLTDFKKGLKPGSRIWEVFSILELTSKLDHRLFPQWKQIYFNTLGK